MGIPVDSVGMEDMGTYVCTISNVCGSVTSEPIPLKVRQVVTMDGFMEDRLECGQEAQTIELVSKAVGENYAWFKVGGADTDTLSHDRDPQDRRCDRRLKGCRTVSLLYLEFLWRFGRYGGLGIQSGTRSGTGCALSYRYLVPGG